MVAAVPLCQGGSAHATLLWPGHSLCFCGNGGGGTGLEGYCKAILSCRKVYEFLSTFIVTGMRFLLSQQVGL